MNRTVLALLALSCAPAIAAETGEFSVPNGEIAYSLDRMAGEVTFTHADRKVVIPSYYEPSEYGRWGDWVLVFLPEGGSACPGNFAWLTIDKFGLKPSPVFGTCSDLIEIEEGEGVVNVSMPRLGGSGYSSFVFDGTLVHEIDLGLKPSGVDDPLTASSWAGRPVYDMLTAAEMEPVFLAIMDWQELEAVRAAGTIYNEGFTEDKGWYVATACKPHACNVESAGVAINIADGSVIVGHWTEAGGGTLHGDPTAAIPNKLRSLLRDGKS